MSILIGLFLIFYLILAVKKLPWAVMMMLALLPTYQIRFDVLGVPFTLLEGMILVAFGIWLSQNYKRIIKNVRNRLKGKLEIGNWKLVRYPFDLEIILLLLISWVAIIVAGGSNAALGVWKAYFFEPVLVFILVLNVFRCDANTQINTNPRIANMLEMVMWPFMFSALGVSLVAIFQRVTGLFVVEEFWPRVTGVFSYPNALGLYLGPLVLVMLGWLGTRLSIVDCRMSNLCRCKNIIIAFTILSSLIAIVLARSEGAVAGVLIAVVLLGGIELILYLKKKLYKVVLGIFGVVIFIMLIYPVLVLNVFPKYYYPNTGCLSLNYAIKKLALKDLSGEIRKQQWRETRQMLKADNVWLWGTGLSGYQEKIEPYHQEGIFFNFSGDPDFRRKIVWWDEKYKAENWQPVEIYMYPHNLVLNFWTELGILGAVLFVWIIGKYLYVGIGNCLFRARSREELGNKGDRGNRYIVLGLVGAMVVIVVHGIVDVPYFKNDLAVLFWVLVAMLSMFNMDKLPRINESFHESTNKKYEEENN